MDNKKYIFCRNCGEKYDEPVKFCRKCGEKIVYQQEENIDVLEAEDKEEIEIKDNYKRDIKENPRNKNSGKLPIILIILLIVFALGFGAFWYTNTVVFSSDKLINEFEESCNENNMAQLKEILVSEKTGTELKENEIEQLIKYLEENPNELSEICNNLKDKNAINSNSELIYIREVDGILGKVGKKEIVLKPIDIKIYVPTDDIKILMDDKEYTSDGNGYINIDSLYIGKYNIKAECNNNFRKLEENIEIEISDNDYKSEYSVFTDIKSITIDTQYPDAYVVLNYENTGKTVAELNYILYPVKSDDKISLEYTRNNEVFSSELKIVADNSYLYFDTIEGLESYLIEESTIEVFENNLERSVRSLMQAYSESFAYAINDNNFEQIAYHLYPGSNIYNMQQEFINTMALKNYYISFVSLSITNIQYDENTKSGSFNAREVYDTYLEGKTDRMEQNFTYSFKYNENEKAYQLTNLQ